MLLIVFVSFLGGDMSWWTAAPNNEVGEHTHGGLQTVA